MDKWLAGVGAVCSFASAALCMYEAFTHSGFERTMALGAVAGWIALSLINLRLLEEAE